MERRSIISTNLKEVGYDPDKEILEVKFTWGGLYHYFKVPEEQYINLMTTKSAGKYFNKFISPKYDYKIM